MKHVLLFITLGSLALFSCQKPYYSYPPTGTLAGSWRMIVATDNASGLSTTKPASIQGDVDITFTQGIGSGGTFTGLTPTNQISKSNYSTGPGQSLSVLNMFMTKLAETTWGADFVNNIRDAKRYSFDKSGRLIIETTGKTLTFIKH